MPAFFFSKRNISGVSNLNELTQKNKKKTYDAIDLLAFSLVSITVCVYSLGKSIIVHICKHQHEMILSYANPFNKKFRKLPVKIWAKTCEQFLSTLNG